MTKYTKSRIGDGKRVITVRGRGKSTYNRSHLSPGERKRCRDCKLSAICLTCSPEETARMFRRCYVCGKIQCAYVDDRWGLRDQWFTEKDVCARFTDFMELWGIYAYCPQCHGAQTVS